MLSNYRKRLGRRGALLITAGFAWTGIGLNLFFLPMPRFSNPINPYDPILMFFDQSWFGFLWVFAGLIAIVSGVYRIRNHAHDAIGYNAILTPPLVWTLVFLWSYLSWLFSGGQEGRATGIYSFIVWALISSFVLIIAGWPEPRDVNEPFPPPHITKDG